MSRFIWKKQIFPHIFRAYDVKKKDLVILKKFKNHSSLEREHKSIQHIKYFSKISNTANLTQDSEMLITSCILSMPYILGNDILDHVASKRKMNMKIKEKGCRELLYDMSQCVDALQRRNLAHLDIKPENFVITKLSQDENRVTLIDFFCLENIYGIEEKRLPEHIGYGTKMYWSPEVKYKSSFHKNTDLWGIGVSAAVISLGYHPLDIHGVTIHNIQSFIHDNLKSANYSNEFIENINSLLEINPQLRKNGFLS
tara:strand:+ start:330 stop:1094 length:765 start_codon:yes stop_codon:yes gene_type:complete